MANKKEKHIKLHIPQHVTTKGSTSLNPNNSNLEKRVISMKAKPKRTISQPYKVTSITIRPGREQIKHMQAERQTYDADDRNHQNHLSKNLKAMNTARTSDSSEREQTKT